MRKAIAAVAAILALASCVSDRQRFETPFLDGEDPAAPQSSRTPGGPVLAIGDSIMVGIDDYGHLGAVLALDGWELETVAERGRSTRWAVNEIEEREDRLPRHVIVALGSNPGLSSDGFEEDVEDLRALLIERGARRILWIPPYSIDPERYAEKVRILAEADRAERRMVVPPWGEVLDEHPEWLIGDGLHLSESGYTALAVFISEWLEQLV